MAKPSPKDKYDVSVHLTLHKFDNEYYIKLRDYNKMVQEMRKKGVVMEHVWTEKEGKI